MVKLPDAVSFEVGAATLLTYLDDVSRARRSRGAAARRDACSCSAPRVASGSPRSSSARCSVRRVIAAASTDDKLAFCREHGASETINYATEDLKERIKALTSGNGVDVVYDPVGGALAESALRGIAWQGRYLVVGFAAGEIPKIPLNLVLLKGCQIVGVFWGSFAMREPAKNRAHARAIFEWVAAGKLAPAIDAVLPFAEAGAALTRLDQRTVKGKLVLVP